MRVGMAAGLQTRGAPPDFDVYQDDFGSPICASPGLRFHLGVEHHFTTTPCAPGRAAVPHLHGGADYPAGSRLHGGGTAVA